MADLVLSSSGKPLTIADITNLEQTLGVTFPDQYRNFLLKHNGGKPDRTIFSFNEDGLDSDDILRCFLVIDGDKRYNDLQDYITTYHQRIPEELLPIGFDPGGNLICLGVKGEQLGKVYFWDHEQEYDDEEIEEAGIVGYRNVYFVANSFTEFVDMLKEPTDED